MFLDFVLVLVRGQDAKLSAALLTISRNGQFTERNTFQQTIVSAVNSLSSARGNTCHEFNRRIFHKSVIDW